MLPVTEASFVLDAITLRGVGSYLLGARLELKPLTILCGANGSGKSTWLKALNLLKQSTVEQRLPFGFSVADWHPDNIQITNAFYHLSEPNEFERLDDPQSLDAYGTAGTIGLEIHATEDVFLPSSSEPDNKRDAGWNFLWKGVCNANSRLRLRFAHPTHWQDSQATPELTHVIELTVNEKYTIRIEGERDPLQGFVEGYVRPRRSKPYTLSLSSSFLTSHEDGDEKVVQVATIHDLITPRFDTDSDFDTQEISEIFELFDQRIRDTVKMVLDGYFYVGAVRQPEMSLKLDEVHSGPAKLPDRYVGPGGEASWQREADYGSATMRFAIEPMFLAEDIQPDQFFQQLFESTSIFGDEIEHIWQRSNDEVRRRVEAFRAASNSLTTEESAQLAADLLNSVLNDRGLFDFCDWAAGGTDEYGELIPDWDNPPDWIDDIGDFEIWCLGREVESLTEPELRVLNHLLVLRAFSGNPPPITNRRWECSFNAYLNTWLSRLVGVTLNPANPAAHWSKGQRFGQWSWPIGRNLVRKDMPTPFFHRYSLQSAKHTTLARTIHPCFGSGSAACAPQPPRQLSSGFHQVFPIVVQLGMMHRGELLAVENPEVHLHPSLQMKIAEMLIEHARSGRRIIVETHSDLFVRRVIRALLEEDLPQSALRIYFVSLRSAIRTLDSNVDFHSSTLEQIQVDERGRIANWPEGFMDDDVRESQRLMDIMYGHQDEGDADD